MISAWATTARGGARSGDAVAAAAAAPGDLPPGPLHGWMSSRKEARKRGVAAATRGAENDNDDDDDDDDDGIARRGVVAVEGPRTATKPCAADARRES